MKKIDKKIEKKFQVNFYQKFCNFFHANMRAFKSNEEGENWEWKIWIFF